jgi:hypothetical protein
VIERFRNTELSDRDLAKTDPGGNYVSYADLVLLITNDSTDTTPDILSHWTVSSEGVQVLSLNGLAASIKARTDRLAVARNLGLHHLRQAMGSGRRFDVLVAIDTVGSILNLLRECFRKGSGVGAERLGGCVRQSATSIL